MKKLLIKVGRKYTNFIVTESDRLILYKIISLGEYDVVLDVAKCMGIDTEEAEKRVKDIVTKEKLSLKHEKILEEIMEARLIAIFEIIKKELNEKGINSIEECFIASANQCLPNIKKNLNKIMGIEPKMFDLEDLKIQILDETS
jgi:cell division ATPase FtsA